MIDVRLLRTDLEGVRAALGRRGGPALVALVEHAADLDARLRDITVERDAIRAKVNEISKAVGRLLR